MKQEFEKKDQRMDPLIEEYKQNQIKQELKELKEKELLKFKSITKTIDKDHEMHYNYLMTLLNLNPLDQLTNKLHLLYRGSEHNFDGPKFHQLCDGKEKTLVLVKSTTKNLFGGYVTTAWHSNNSLSSAPGSFLFSLDKQTKHKIYKNEGEAIYGHQSYGPIFGGGHDLVLFNNCHSNKKSSTNLGHTYSPPNNISFDTYASQTYLAGSYLNFQVEEYEVFLLIDNI